MRLAIARVLAATHRVVARANRLPLAIAGGLLTPRDRQVRQQRLWAADASCYAEEDRVRFGLTQWEKEIIARWFPAEGRVVVAGCGAGREMIALAEMGYEVEGFDLIPAAAENAKRNLAERGLAGQAVAADAAEYAFDGGPYAAVLFSWYVYSYVCPRAQRIAVLQRLGAALRDDGRVAIVLASPSGPRRGPTLCVAQWVARLTGNPVLPEEGDWLDPGLQWIHVATREEMAEEAQAAGLELVDWVPDPRTVAVLQHA